MAPACYWYLWIHPEGRIPPSRFSFIRLPRSNLPLLHLRLVHPHKVRAVQERYDAYGDRVEIRHDNDLIKGDITNVLKGKHIEWISGR